MRWSRFFWPTLAAVVVVALGASRADGAPNPRAEDMLKTLLELDRMYAAIARPSLRSGPPGPPYVEPKVQRALNVLRLRNLDKMYAEKSRPRFGKRAGDDLRFERGPDRESQEYQAGDSAGGWIPIRR